ncbi:MAG: 50S ribosomal protein L20 [Planctomycetes bacterium]|nr:50S ribosomal protein L20 [Planctomycetota bacterium]
MRATIGHTRHKRKKKYLDAARGFWGRRSKCYKRVRETLFRAWRFAYYHRRLRKRDFRRLWIERISAGARELGLTYSTFIYALRRAQIEVNRKMLADLAVRDPAGFKAIVEQARAKLQAS